MKFSLQRSEKGCPNGSLTKETSGRDNSYTNVSKNDLDLIDAKTLRLQFL